MTDRELVLTVLRAQGKADALALRSSAAGMTGTELIAAEHQAPPFGPDNDYSAWPVGAPVTDGGQVWTLLQPHNAAHYDGRPATLRALWGLCHTTDPAQAKPWVDPEGVSGAYMAGDCYRDAGGAVWRCLADHTVHDAEALPGGWEKVED